MLGDLLPFILFKPAATAKQWGCGVLLTASSPEAKARSGPSGTLVEHFPSEKISQAIGFER